MAKQDYKAMMAELQQLLTDMQSSDIDVDEAMKKYQRGQKLVAQLTEYLQSAENTITTRKLDGQ